MVGSQGFASQNLSCSSPILTESHARRIIFRVILTIQPKELKVISGELSIGNFTRLLLLCGFLKHSLISTTYELNFRFQYLIAVLWWYLISYYCTTTQCFRIVPRAGIKKRKYCSTFYPEVIPQLLSKMSIIQGKITIKRKELKRIAQVLSDRRLYCRVGMLVGMAVGWIRWLLPLPDNGSLT